MEIPLCNILITLFQVHVLNSPYKKYTFALAQVHWLYNECLIILFLVKLLPKIVHFLGQHPGLRKEIIFVGKNFCHPHEISAKVILASQLIHSRVVINPLMRL
jgi:hypothetical protein